MYKSIINNKPKTHDKIVLLAKTKLNTIKIFISKTLTNSYISHDKLVSLNNALKKYDDMKEETKNLKTSTVHQRF